MNIRKTLTVRYALALSLIASMLLLSHFLLLQRIEDAAKSGRTIDTAGMQRMLSQRIALLSLRAANAPDRPALDIHLDKLDSALERMADNHATLSIDWRRLAAEGDTHYASRFGPDGLDERVRGYIDAGRMLLQTYAARGAEAGQSSGAPAELADVATGGELLPALNAVVQRYEAESREKADAMQWLQKLSLAIGLGVLLGEVLLIFRPMVDRIATNIETMREANDELRDISTRISHDLRTPLISSIGLMKVINEALADGEVDEAARATELVYTSMVTLDGATEELMATVRRHREAIHGFADLG